MSSTLPPPFIYIPTLHNLRDIGGYRVSGTESSGGAGKVVRPRAIYRAADPSYMFPEALSLFRNSLGITSIFDLRSTAEIEKAKKEGREAGPKGADEMGITRVWCPVFKDEDYGPEAVAIRFRKYSSSEVDAFQQAYADILASAGPAYRNILLHIVSEAGDISSSSFSPALVHCTAGKDRTGVFIAILLCLLGVDEDIVAEEYSLTDQGLKDLKPPYIEKLIHHEAYAGLGEAQAREAAERLLSSKKQSMVLTLAYLREKYGGAEGYVRSNCGLGDSDIAAIRRNLLIPSSELLLLRTDTANQADTDAPAVL